MSENVVKVMNGFYQLAALEKKQVVDAINEYFDSNDREPIRAEHDRKFEEISKREFGCPCCGRGAHARA